MDSPVFRDDSTKVASIMGLLSQANEVLSDVKLHLDDYGERLRPETAQLAESQLIEIDRLKQNLYEKDDELRVLRTDRIKLSDELQAAQQQLKTAQETVSELTAKRQETESSLEGRCRLLENEVRRLTDENKAYARKLKRAHEQTEALLKTKEELLDIVKISDVSIKRPVAEKPEEPPPPQLAIEGTEP